MSESSEFQVHRSESVFGMALEGERVTDAQVRLEPAVDDGLAVEHLAGHDHLLREAFAGPRHREALTDAEVHLVLSSAEDCLVTDLSGEVLVDAVVCVAQCAERGLNVGKLLGGDLASCIQPAGRASACRDDEARALEDAQVRTVTHDAVATRRGDILLSAEGLI